MLGMLKWFLLALIFGVSIQAASRNPNTAEWFGPTPIVVEVAVGVFTIFIAVLFGAYVSDYIYGKGRKGKYRKGYHPILR